MPSACVISAIAPAVSITSCSLSITQGPAIRNGRLPAPTLNDPISTSCAIALKLSVSREMLKPVFQQGRRRVKTGGVASLATLRILTSRERSWKPVSASHSVAAFSAQCRPDKPAEQADADGVAANYIPDGTVSPGTRDGPSTR